MASFDEEDAENTEQTINSANSTKRAPPEALDDLPDLEDVDVTILPSPMTPESAATGAGVPRMGEHNLVSEKVL